MPQRPGLRSGKAEADVVKLQPAARRRLGARPIGDLGWRIEDLGNPVRRRHRLLSHRHEEAQRGDRPHQGEHHRDEGNQGSQRHQIAAGGVGAEAEHDDQRDAGDDLQQRPELGRDRDLLDLGVVQLDCLFVEPVVDVVLAAEGLHRPKSQGGLLDMGCDVTGLILCLAR